MNLFADIRTLVTDCLEAMVAEGALPAGLSFDNVTAEPPRDAAHGDMATNAAMVLAKPAAMISWSIGVNVAWESFPSSSCDRRVFREICQHQRVAAGNSG